MGISRDSLHKRAATGGKRAQFRKKRKFELGRQSANTKIGAKRIHTIRVRGGNEKHRALRLETGNFSWGSESVTRKVRVIRVVYNSTNNEIVRTNTLVKGNIIEVDATPFRQWYEAHYGISLGRKKTEEALAEDLLKKKGAKSQAKIEARKATSAVETHLAEQFSVGRVLAKITSRPGQSGRCDGYILEGKELDFYSRRLRSKK